MRHLRSRFYAGNISKVFPLICDAFIGKYIELGFLENLASKSEVQDAHFSRKQYFLHSAVVEPEENKYVYRLDQNHVFVHEVLENIFQRWDIKNNTVIIKIDNAPTLRYKNKYAF